jgi:hypothetical protein
MGIDHGTCLALHLFVWHIPMLYRIPLCGYAFVYFQLAQIKAIAKHVAQHGLWGAPGVVGESFKATLLRSGKCQGSHMACSQLNQHN